jgi:hypothetical protein
MQVSSRQHTKDSEGNAVSWKWAHSISNVTHWMLRPNAPSTVMKRIEITDEEALTKFLDKGTLKGIIEHVGEGNDYSKIYTINGERYSLQLEWTYLTSKHRILRCNSRFNIFDENYKLISNEWFDYVLLEGDLINVEKDHLYNYLRIDGTMLFNVWFDGCFSRGNVIVLEKGKKKNLATRDGKILLNEWVDDIELMDAEFPYAIKDGKRCYLAKDGSVCEFPPHMSFKNLDD